MQNKSTLSENRLIESSMPKCSLGKEIFYGLTILLDLADAFDRHGCYLTTISQKHNFSLSELEPIVFQLEQAGLLDHKPGDPNWLFLKEEPDNFWIVKILPIIKDSFKKISI